MEKHRKRVGYGKMSKNTRFDSLETDSFGVRLVLKTPVNMRPFISSIEGDVTVVKVEKKRTVTKISKKERQIAMINATEEPQAIDPSLVNAIAAGLDEGRAKLFTGACMKKQPKRLRGKSEICYDRIVADGFQNCDYEEDKWEITTLTRKQYFNCIKLRVRRKWEASRIAANPSLRNAYNDLSLASLRSCDPQEWDRRIAIETTHGEVLNADLFGDKERERWRMIAFRKKKMCLDRAIGNMISSALHGEVSPRRRADGSVDLTNVRPLVLGIGDAAFPANGPRGEIAVPTSKLAAAYKRAVARVRKTGRRVAILPISERYTTKACCDCGSTTTPAKVLKRWKTRIVEVQNDSTVVIREEWRQAYGESCRLRCCTHCKTIGKLRDRDDQAAQNMQRATVALINGQARPPHLCEAAHIVNKPIV